LGGGLPLGLAVELDARLLDRRAMLLCPARETLDRLEQGLAQTGQLVVDAGWDLGKHRSRDETIALEPAQREGQHALGDAFGRASERGETDRSMGGEGHDLHAPLVANSVKHLANGRARMRVDVPR